VTESQPLEARLAELVENLEALSVETKVSPPKREQRVDALLEEARDALRMLREQERRYEERDELRELVAVLRDATTASHERQCVSEARLDQFEAAQAASRAGQLPPLDPKIVREGEWLKARLAGPPTDAEEPRFFIDATTVVTEPAIDVLRRALAGEGPQTYDEER
jgi:hypothetical protein